MHQSKKTQGLLPFRRARTWTMEGLVLIATVLALVLSAVPAVGQSSSTSQDASTGDGAFSDVIDVRVVNLEVVVERRGQRVTGLDASDFLVTVDGEPVAIDYFSEIRSKRAQVGDGDLPTAPGAGSGESIAVNYLLYIDDNRTLKARRNPVIQNLIAQLDAMGPEDQMAIVVHHGNGLDLVTPWTSDRAAMRKGLDQLLIGKRYNGSLQSPRLVARRQAIANSRGSAIGAGNSVYAGFSVDGTRDNRHEFVTNRALYDAANLPRLPSLNDVGRAEEASREMELAVDTATSALRGFERPLGRKVFLYMPGSLPAGGFRQTGRLRDVVVGQFEMLVPLIETANLLGYTVYPIDTVAPLVRLSQVGGLKFVASQTGGRALHGGNQLAVLDQVAEDTSTYYWLGFSPEFTGADTDHIVKVEVTRPGVRVRSRQGYVDLSHSTQLELMTQGALLFPDAADREELDLELGLPRKLPGRKIAQSVRVTIPTGTLTFLPTAGGSRSDVEIRFAVVDNNGQQAAIPSQRLTIWEDELTGDTFVLDADMKLRRRPHDLVITVHDLATSRLLTGRARIEG